MRKISFNQEGTLVNYPLVTEAHLQRGHHNLSFNSSYGNDHALLLEQ